MVTKFDAASRGHIFGQYAVDAPDGGSPLADGITTNSLRQLKSCSAHVNDAQHRFNPMLISEFHRGGGAEVVAELGSTIENTTDVNGMLRS